MGIPTNQVSNRGRFESGAPLQQDEDSGGRLGDLLGGLLGGGRRFIGPSNRTLLIR